jgi:hypothetical protein
VASVFISYSSKDQKKVERLAAALRQGKDITVWLDTIKETYAIMGLIRDSGQEQKLWGLFFQGNEVQKTIF